MLNEDVKHFSGELVHLAGLELHVYSTFVLGDCGLPALIWCRIDFFCYKGVKSEIKLNLSSHFVALL